MRTSFFSGVQVIQAQRTSPRFSLAGMGRRDQQTGGNAGGKSQETAARQPFPVSQCSSLRKDLRLISTPASGLEYPVEKFSACRSRERESVAQLHVPTIDILAQLEVPVVVHPGGLVDEYTRTGCCSGTLTVRPRSICRCRYAAALSVSPPSRRTARRSGWSTRIQPALKVACVLSNRFRAGVSCR